MTDSRIRLYQAITDIDDDIIEEAQGITKKPTTVRFLVLAASFCIIIAGAIMLFSQNELPIYPGQNADLQTPSVQENPPASTTVDYTPSVPDYSAINYSSLALPAAQADPAIMEQFSNYSADILPFDEAFLSDCCGILEGTIKRIYPKHYTYDFYDDKFGETELYHSFSDSIVYELEIEKVWYGTAFTERSTILVEDQFYFPDMYFSLMEGRTYVLPIYEYGDSANTLPGKEVTSGDLTRDSVYSTVYPFHPQITKTEDGCYLVTTDWPSLTTEPCRTINMEEVDSYESFFKDKLRLVYEEDFAERILSVIHTSIEVG